MAISADFAVDVVIPVRDGARFIGCCLDSIKAQSMPVRSAIVVDDGSTDDTAKIVEIHIKRWPALRLVRTGRRGVSHARNTGISKCEAPFAAFLDSDDVWEPTKLERQMQLLSAAPARIGLVHCSYYHMNENGQRIDSSHIIAPKRRSDVLHDLLVEGNIISGSCSAVVVRRELLEQAGGFDERLTFGEDWDLWLRLAEVTGEFDFVPEALVGIRLHDQSTQGIDLSQREERFLIQSLLILDRWYSTARFPRRMRADYRRKITYLAIQRARQKSAPQWRVNADLYQMIKCCDARFGRDLFASKFDFHAAVASSRSFTFLGKILRSILPLALRDIEEIQSAASFR